MGQLRRTSQYDGSKLRKVVQSLMWSLCFQKQLFGFERWFWFVHSCKVADTRVVRLNSSIGRFEGIKASLIRFEVFPSSFIGTSSCMQRSTRSCASSTHYAVAVCNPAIWFWLLPWARDTLQNCIKYKYDSSDSYVLAPVPVNRRNYPVWFTLRPLLVKFFNPILCLFHECSYFYDHFVLVFVCRRHLKYI